MTPVSVSVLLSLSCLQCFHISPLFSFIFFFVFRSQLNMLADIHVSFYAVISVIYPKKIVNV